MLPDIRADMTQRMEEEANRFSQSSEAVQWTFQRWKSHSNREVKEATSGINIYWESITALLGVEATAVKWQARLGGTGGRENGEHFEAASERCKCGDPAKASEWDTPAGSWVCESSVNYKVPPQSCGSSRR